MSSTSFMVSKSGIQRIRCALVALLLVSSSALMAGTYQDVDRPFSFELYTANIFPWVDGTREGPVGDTRGRMVAGLKELIDSADRKIEVSIYGVKKQQWFLDTLMRMKRKSGVSVEAVVDQHQGEVGDWNPDNFDYPDTAQLAGLLGTKAIKPDTDRHGNTSVNSIMHNKFVVVDRKKLWFGSANISHTDAGSEYNANVALLVRNPEIARLYSDEFRQMFHEGRFSSEKFAREDQRPFRFSDGTIVEVFFSPQDDPMNRAILDFVRRARKTLDISMFFLTDTKAATALKDAVKRGVKVRLIYDALASAHAASKHSWLRDQGIDVRVENWGGKMHMKAAIADSSDVLLGSLNWSSAGSLKNDENTMVIRRNQALASELSAYFRGLWASLEPVADPSAGDDRRSNGRSGHRDPRAEGIESINSCNDGLDNDHDGLVDADDEGCADR